VIPGEPLRAEIRWSSGEFATFVLSAQGRHKRREVLLEGTGGVVCFDDVKTPRLSGSGALFTSLGSAEIGSEEPLVLELKHFVSCIIQGRAFRTDVAEGVQVVRLLELGQRSLDSSGSWVAATMPGGHANDCAAP
jgi:predicted dehydrogenase